MIDALITSQTRIKLLLKFFMNPNNRAYLRELAREFGESTNSVRLELNKLQEANIISSQKEGRQVVYQANQQHPLFPDIRNIVLKSSGISSVINNILENIGELKMAFITGDYARGQDSGLIDLVLVGENINEKEVDRVKKKTEGLIDRKIRILLLKESEYQTLKKNFTEDKILTLWKI